MNDLSALLKLLPVLAAVAQTGGVTAAAAELGIPQPTASRSLARLSELAGAPLVRREGRGVVLTEAGLRLAESAQEGLAVITAGLAEVRRAGAIEDGRISIAFQTLLGESFVPDVIRRFRQRWPRVGFGLRHGSRALCLQAVADGEAELAIVADPPGLTGTTTTALYTEPLLAVVHSRHPLAARRSVSLDELRGLDLIMLSPGYGLHESARRLLSVDGHDPVPAFEVGDYRAARGLAAAGLGVTILPPSPSSIDDGVREIPIDDPRATREIGVLVRPTGNPVVPEFVRALGAAARARPGR
ncbi:MULTISPECIES: LysR family transcriptional regulator [unclassified Rathayibacter]|uniref:LysR family transcriptional regulator n=1 Tax=unclassified Rathayibacter TaxID=2609250 RepID=UPI00188AAD0E|nr:MULTISPECIES: LysR family transcriptional regulator [unclassified Rathayibacter]MBF4463212.1 LysR family transcriptional regulator [Rathayibacter sp. VKM Ac-2879]MBF4504551.1 LysR family transcriptional regulator [Rathayibacter sp. VKM Ac-2878]